MGFSLIRVLSETRHLCARAQTAILKQREEDRAKIGRWARWSKRSGAGHNCCRMYARAASGTIVALIDPSSPSAARPSRGPSSAFPLPVLKA